MHYVCECTQVRLCVCVCVYVCVCVCASVCAHIDDVTDQSQAMGCVFLCYFMQI